MTHIALCDDEQTCLDYTKHLILQWSSEKDIPVKIDCFDNGDNLLEHIKRIRTDIILLDIIMPLLNGMDTAKEIRNIDKNIKIIFLTSSPEFALESYSIKAFDYILKPIRYERLAKVLDECTLELKEEPKNLILKSECGYQKIYLRDIEYIEAQNKQIAFYLQNKKCLLITQPLYSFENKLLIEDGFFKCHRSYIVSMPKVDSFTSSEIFMKSGSRIPIARGIGKSFHDAYFSFMFQD